MDWREMTIRLASDMGRETCDLSFAREIKEKSQTHLERCYQCAACSSGCPVAFGMDYSPHQIIRMAQLGLKERVLDSTTIWLCASCHTCAARCPNDIDIVKFMDTLRTTSLRLGRTQRTSLPLFHATFLDGIESRGRVHELTLIIRYTLASGDIFKFKNLFKDMILGLKMFIKGKLVVFSSKIKGLDEVKRIFQSTKRDNRLENE
jgi:heterodisulfide reductase subunit C